MTTANATSATEKGAGLSAAKVEELFATEVCASFAVSRVRSGELVAHVHWRGQEPVRSWVDVARMHEESHLWPCFFGGAYWTLIERDGRPPADLVDRLFGDWAREPQEEDQ